MSETDDTDVLLLIPPDFFLVRSSGSEDSLLESSRTVVHKPQSCTAQVIGKLVDQVHSLESRLETLEINTTVTDSSIGSVTRRKNLDTDSVDSKSFDSKYYTFPRRRRRRKFAKTERRQDRSLTSLDSLSTLRSVPRLKLQESDLLSLKSKDSETINDFKSMDGDLSSIVSTPSKKNDKLLLNEIDEFLTKVEAYETTDSQYKDIESSVSPENVIKATGDYISNKLDIKNDEIKLPSDKAASTSVLEKYIYLVKNNPQLVTQSDTVLPSTSALKDHEKVETSITRPLVSNYETPKQMEPPKIVTEVKSPSIRKLNYLEKDVQPTSTPKKTTFTDSFRPSTNKIYDRASKVLEQYKNQNQSRTQSSLTDSYLKEDFKMPQMRPFVDNKESLKNKFIESIDTDLLSLSELWGEKTDKDRGDSKLEEERLKREHCEAMIQQLQKKLLDQQERLAVAIKVDRAKDAAILKLKDSWLKLTGNLDKAEERHKQELNKVLREAENFKQVAGEAQKKTNHFEAELYKALDLAHDYQEKCKNLMAQNKEVQDTTDRALALKDEEISIKEKQIQALQDNYDTMMRLNKQSTDCVKNLEEALAKEKADHETSKDKVTELVRKIQSVDDETSLLRQERDLVKEKLGEERARCQLLEKQLQEKQNLCSELLCKCDNLDAEIKTLRKHLDLQKNELKTHYQKQLEDAVLAKLQEFQQQLDIAEREMESEAKRNEAHIVDTYNKQIVKIEEQHKLEINVLEEKQREEIKLYRLQLAQASEKIGLLESKVESYRRRRGQLATQLHGVMEAQWRQALLILTSGHAPDASRSDTVSTPAGRDYGPPALPPRYAPHPPHLPHPPGGAGGGGGLRTQEGGEFNFEALSDHELQQYVKLLLTKPAAGDSRSGGGDAGMGMGGIAGIGVGLGGGTGGEGVSGGGEEPTSDRPERERRTRRSLGNKPPWKA